MFPTYNAETPTPPAWVQAQQATRWAWTTHLDWRVNAARATTGQYRRHLIRDAAARYARHLEAQGLRTEE